MVREWQELVLAILKIILNMIRWWQEPSDNIFFFWSGKYQFLPFLPCKKWQEPWQEPCLNYPLYMLNTSRRHSSIIENIFQRLIQQDSAVIKLIQCLQENMFQPVNKILIQQDNTNTSSKLELHSSSLQEDIAHVELKSVSGGDTVFTKSIFVRFNDLDLRWFHITILNDTSAFQKTFWNLFPNQMFKIYIHCRQGSQIFETSWCLPGWEYGQTKAMQRKTR